MTQEVFVFHDTDGNHIEVFTSLSAAKAFASTYFEDDEDPDWLLDWLIPKEEDARTCQWELGDYISIQKTKVRIK